MYFSINFSLNWWNFASRVSIMQSMAVSFYSRRASMYCVIEQLASYMQKNSRAIFILKSCTTFFWISDLSRYYCYHWKSFELEDKRWHIYTYCMSICNRGQSVDFWKLYLDRWFRSLVTLRSILFLDYELILMH